MLTWDNQKYYYLSWVTTELKLTWDLVTSDFTYLMRKKDNIIQTIPSMFKPANYFSSVMYFLQVRWWYLMDKNANSFITCSKWNDTNCGDGRFLEKNFCVDVVYFDWKKNRIGWCSSMTNFKK